MHVEVYGGGVSFYYVKTQFHDKSYNFDTIYLYV